MYLYRTLHRTLNGVYTQKKDTKKKHSLWVSDIGDARRFHAKVHDLRENEIVVRQALLVQLVDAQAARTLLKEKEIEILGMHLGSA